MICYLVRHGKDDETVRGGWSAAPLTGEGIRQSERLACTFAEDQEKHIVHVFTSDLPRAFQTAEILAAKLNLPLSRLPDFREVNNGALSGMKNSEALEKYPGLFWRTLEWEEPYPQGESPRAFYERIVSAWEIFAATVRNIGGDVILVTHSGVINVILHIINGTEYSNKDKPYPVQNAQPIAVEI
ncbi:MAG: histidine phosphatase family protein [Oscillospiraceae bacterium]|nr:histidine phosphatase family protein [Oscillospiraceae bacterium]